MKKYFKYIFLLVLFSCEKEELPIQPHIPGNSEVNQISLLPDYSRQVFYHLNKNETVSENTKTDWDLLFYENNEEHHIILNSSTYAKSASVDLEFDSEINISELDFISDSPEGINSGLSITNIYSKTIVVDRGFNLNGTQRGYKKFNILEINNEYIDLIIANLDNSQYEEVRIHKELGKEKYTYSFDDGVVSIFPEDMSWDLLFTQYTHIFNDGTTYLLTGVLTNYLNNVTVSIDTINEFNLINFSDIDNYNFSSNQDFIGYGWKNYNHSSGVFTIIENINYIIKDVNGFYFKMRFIDYYNESGEKGYPKFEIQKL
tara:strand:- start:2376 stop:3323 length:948 start_codon:yes stop_codon:yes gene_type:complete